MPQRLVEITSTPGLLPALVRAKQGSAYSIIERGASFYLSFFDSDNPRETEKAKQYADALLSNINAILILYAKIPNALEKTGRIITIDDNGHEVEEKTRIIPASAAISQNFDIMDFSSFLEMEVKISKLSHIKQVLYYYASGLNWFSLYDAYECIRKDCYEMMGSGIFEQWTTDIQGRNRLQDFTESANNAFISGYSARHSYADSKEIECINASLIRLKENGSEVMPMSLNEAGTFIENLLIQWLRYRGIKASTK